MTDHCQVRDATILELLARRAAEHPDRVAYAFLDEQGDEVQLTFTELDTRARAIAVGLSGRLQVGDRALLVYPAGLEFITAFFGCLYAGVVAIPATYPKPRRPLPRMNRIALDSGATLALTTAQTLSTIDREQVVAEVGQIEWLATDQVALDQADRWQQPKIAPEDLAFLQYTSGSTSDPKGVMVSHANLLANLEVIAGAFGINHPDRIGGDSTGVFWLPAYHDMGLIGGILTPLFVGGRSVLMAPPSFLQRPMRWLQAIHDNRAMISGAPNFAYELCVQRTTPEERAALDLSSWTLAFCGAEPIRAETLEQFADAFRPAKFDAQALYPCYGLAESTLLAAGANHAHEPTIMKVNRPALAQHKVVAANGEPAAQIQRLVGCGTAVPGHELVIVDPVTNLPHGDNQVGEIFLRGPSVAAGYWNRPEETERTFGGKIQGVDGRFLRTGDLGFTRDGELYVTGRLKDVIIIRGRNHYPQDIEQTAQAAHPAVLPGAAFSVPVDGAEQLVLVHQIDRQYRGDACDEVIRAIRRAVVENHEMDPHAVVIIRQTSLPVTSSGKVQRSFCREQYLTNKLKVVRAWTRPTPGKRAPARQNGRPTAPHADVAQPASLGRSAGARQVTVDAGGVHWKGESGAAIRPAPHRPGPGNPANRGIQIDRVSERIETWLLEWLIERAGLEPSEVRRDRPFAEFGVDSLTAIELSQELADEFGVEVTPIVAWNYPTPDTLARYLAEQTLADAASPPASTTPTNGQALQTADACGADADLERLLAEVEQLTDEEAVRLLAQSEPQNN